MRFEEPRGPNIRPLEMKHLNRTAISISLPIKSEFGIGMQLIRDASLCFPICELPFGESDRVLSFQNTTAITGVDEGDNKTKDHRLPN